MSEQPRNISEMLDQAKVALVADGLIDDGVVDFAAPGCPDRRRRGRPHIVPCAGGSQMIRPELWDAIVEDLGGQLQRARGEAALLASAGSPEAAVGDVGEKAWRVMHPGLSTLLDHAIGGSR